MMIPAVLKSHFPFEKLEFLQERWIVYLTSNKFCGFQIFSIENRFSSSSKKDDNEDDDTLSI